MVRGDWGDRRRLAYQVQEAEAQEAEVQEAEALEAEVLEAEVVEAEALEAVRGLCQNRQIQEEGRVLRARTARLRSIALAAAINVTITIRSQPEKKGAKAKWNSFVTLSPAVRHPTSRS